MVPYCIVLYTNKLRTIVIGQFYIIPRSVLQIEGVFSEAPPCVVYAEVDLDGQVSIVADNPPQG